MKKIPTLDEILEYKRLVREGAINGDYTLEGNAKLSGMTVQIFQVPMEDEVRALAWKYCKNLANYSHCPVTKAEYKRMQKYTGETALVDVVLKALEGYYPTNENHIMSGFDIVGFYYSVALISQCTYRRNDCLAFLEKLTDYEIQNLDDKGKLMLRNMQALEKEYPDLKEFSDKLKAAQE